jgi:gliding motility-associated-like protein
MLYFPNAFTPNDDGINDLFYTKGRGIKTFKMYIYNRWGDLIFYTEDRTEGWDGRSNQGEKISEQEVYITVFETTDFLDENHYYVGKLVLVR